MAPISEKRSIRILHVDDDPCFLDISKKILSMETHFELDGATSVAEALMKLSTVNYDAIISDYEMPQKNGLQFLRELREHKNDIPFILFTGKGREEVAIKALNLGSDAFINKQGDPETVYGELSHALVKAIDRKTSKRLLVESELKYRKLVENSQEGIAIFQGLSPKFIFANSAMGKILGYTPEELVALSPEEITKTVHVDDRETFFDRFRKRLEGNHFESIYQFRGIRKDGQQRWLEVHSTQIESNGQPTLQSVFLDITERKKAEDDLKMVANIFDLATDSIFVHDLDGKIIYFNEVACKSTGYSSVEMSKLNIKNLDAPESAKFIKPRINGLLEKGDAVFQSVQVRKDKSLIQTEIHARVISQDGKKLVLSVARDITNRKEAEEATKRAMEKLVLVTEKLNVVSSLTMHDVRNKLCALTGNAYLLKKKYADQADILEGLSRMEQAVKDSMKIFEFAKIYEQLGIEELKYIDVENTLKEALALFSGSPFKVINDCHGLSLFADSFFRQIFFNFIDNTRKYGEKTSAIRVYYEKAESGGLRLIYEDDGVGISAEDKLKLFKEGFSTGCSTGYGLFLSKKMIDVYGWQIRENGESGKGVKLEIEIPPLSSSGKQNYILTA